MTGFWMHSHRDRSQNVKKEWEEQLFLTQEVTLHPDENDENNFFIIE